MAIRLHNAGTTLTAAPNPRWKSLAFSTVFLVLVFLALSSQSFLFDGPRPDRTHTSKKLHSSQGVFDVAEGQDRPLVLYAYADSPNALQNLQFFLKRGLHARADFVFIFNGETEAYKFVPNLENVKIVHRNNTCYDMGALGEVLAKDRLWQKYKRFITLNASIRGPFLPMWSDDCWTDVFLNKITEKVKLVGLTYQCAPSPHVQSMLLATDYTGMKILLDPSLAYSVPLNTWPWGGPELPTGYSVCYEDYGQAYIPSRKVHAEIGMARLIQSQGYDVDVMMTAYHAMTPDVYCQQPATRLDTLKNGGYFGSNMHPYEIVFAKANRGIDENLLQHMTSWHYSMNETSWDTCGRREAK